MVSRKESDPHYGEPAKDDPHYGEGGEAKPDLANPEQLEKAAKDSARASGEEAVGKRGESGGMASAY